MRDGKCCSCRSEPDWHFLIGRTEIIWRRDGDSYNACGKLTVPRLLRYLQIHEWERMEKVGPR